MIKEDINMSNTNHKSSGFDYEPVGRVYSSDTKIVTHKDGTISLKPSQSTNTNKQNGKK